MKGGKTVLNELPTLTEYQFPFITNCYFIGRKKDYSSYATKFTWLGFRREEREIWKKEKRLLLDEPRGASRLDATSDRKKKGKLMIGRCFRISLLTIITVYKLQKRILYQKIITSTRLRKIVLCLLKT